MHISLRHAVLLAAFLLSSTPALADVPPPETEPCVGKAAGSACTYNGPGTCQNQICTRPTSGDYACVKCVTGTDTGTATTTTTDSDPQPAQDDSACSIGTHVTARRVAPWVLAAACSLLFFARRHRRR